MSDRLFNLVASAIFIGAAVALFGGAVQVLGSGFSPLKCLAGGYLMIMSIIVGVIGFIAIDEFLFQRSRR